MDAVKGLMILILLCFGTALLVVSACNGLDGLQALAGAACYGVAGKGVA